MPCDVFSSRTLRRMIDNPNGSIIMDVFEYGQTTVGYAAFLTRSGSLTARLYSVVILSRFSGQGLIKEYLQARLAEFAQKGYLRLVLEVRTTNKAAISLYSSLGFSVERRLEGYYADGQDGYRMVKYFR